MLNSCLQDQEHPSCISGDSQISGKYRIAIDNINLENHVIWKKDCDDKFISVNLYRIDTETLYKEVIETGYIKSIVDANVSGVTKHYHNGFGVEVTHMKEYSLAKKSVIFEFFGLDSQDENRIRIPK